MVQGDLIVREWAGAMRGTVIAGGILCASIVASGLPTVALPLSEFGRVYPFWCARRKFARSPAFRRRLARSQMRHDLPNYGPGCPTHSRAAAAVTILQAMPPLPITSGLAARSFVGGLDAARKRRTRRGQADVNKQRSW